MTRPKRVLGPNLTFSNRQIPTLCSWKHLKSLFRLENHNLFKPLEVEVQEIKLFMIASACVKGTWIFVLSSYKKYMTTNSFLLRQIFLYPFVIFKSCITFIISTNFLIQSKIFVDSHGEK